MNFARRTVLSGLSLAAMLPAAAKASQIKDLQTALEKAIQGDGVLRLPAGSFTASNVNIGSPVRIEGVAGLTKIVSPDGAPVLLIEDAPDVSISGVIFDGDNAPPTDGSALVVAKNASGLAIVNCTFTASASNGVRLEGCSGRIAGNRFSDIGKTALFVRDSKGLEITGNHVHDIGNNGIQVWTSTPGEDGTIVSGNRVERIAAKDGGDGQNGNGINVYRAGNVTVSGNRVSDCTFSGVRNNSGSNCQIINNSISRTGEVAIYCEFAFEGAIVSGNLIEDVTLGISITNFNEGGRLAVVANNLVRNVKGGGTLAYTSAVGIAAEADTAVTGNVVENAAGTGIHLGWGKYCRDLSASGNVIRGCGRAIVFSVSEGAGPVMISGNRIAGSKTAAIQGMDQKEVVTGDLGAPDAPVFANGMITGNFVS